MDDPAAAAAALQSPARHALRGFSATLAVGALLASASFNRRALFSFKASQLAMLKLVRPSRNAVAIAVFVGVFRFIDRYERLKRRNASTEPMPDNEHPTKKDDEANTNALVAAAVLSLACVKPDSRTPLVALITTNAVSMWFRDLIAARPELAALKPLELVAFSVTSGWILFSGFFHPDSYEPAHMKLIKRYSLTSNEAADFLQGMYKRGLNPTSCEARHAGRECGEFARNTFVWQTIAMGLRIYAPVHLTTWLLALRHKAVRSKPFIDHLRTVARRLLQSAMYYIFYIFTGWTTICYTNQLGSRSLAWRKFQFLFFGALPAPALLFESPSRRRPIGVILSSYAFVSMGTVLSQQKGFRWLQQSSGPARTVLDVVATATAVAYSFSGIIEGSAVVQRMLLGQPSPSRIRKYSSVDQHPREETRA